MMVNFIKYLLITAQVMLAANASAQSLLNETVQPTSMERLAEPISLTCSGFVIVEWRKSNYLGDISGPTPQGIESLNKICDEGLKKYSEFLKIKKLKFNVKNVNISISLMPANSLLDGKNSRNLNGERFFSAGVEKNTIWGVFYRREGFLFLRNDPIKIVN